ncbi:hypothetical protein B296_00037048 [Ensete ventricosum]|uniref:Uncharacterized protein n=1 Tax=Ensete ventricosum TaxID=4639 RepID=A0A426YY16_ENSVE|nr:hypothetical protein B296_00037048 [Ensete ventricosum]
MIPITSCDQRVPRAVEDFSFSDSAQFVVVSGGFSVGVSYVGYKGYPRVIYGLLLAKSGASRVLLGRSQWISRERSSLAANAPTTGDVGVSVVEKCPSSGAEMGLRKRLRKAIAEQLANASRSTAGTYADKGKGTVELEEAPERGYTMRELCKVKDRAGADRYFASIMTRLKCVEGEDPLVPRWSTISGSSPFWTEGPLSGEYLRGALHPTLVKQVYKCSSEELTNRANKLVVWGLHFVGALINRVHDAGQLIRSQHEKIPALQAANKELKAGVDQELAAAAKRRAKELEAEIERMRLNWSRSEASGGNLTKKSGF